MMFVLCSLAHVMKVLSSTYNNPENTEIHFDIQGGRRLMLGFFFVKSKTKVCSQSAHPMTWSVHF